MIRWTTTRALAQNQGVKILVIGPSGVGKTKLCGTAPRPLIITSESRTQSLADEDLPTAVVRTFAELGDVYQWLATSAEATCIDTCCIDSLSDLCEALLASLKPQYKDIRKAYYDLADAVPPWVRAFRDLPGKHVVMVAKQDWIKDEATGGCKYGPMMPGRQLGPQLPYWFDEVFRMGIGQGSDGKKFRFVQTEADTQYDVKDSSGKLAPYEEPNLTAIINKIIGGARA